MSILVAYATRYGATQEVAEALAATLREHGLEVDFEPLSQVHMLEKYSGVVIGAPLYMFRWHKDMLSFLSRHHQSLMELPVAIFALGPWLNDEKEYKEVRRQLDRELTRFPWLRPIEIAIFGGKFDPAKLTFPHNLIPTLRSIPPSDVRDWTAIRAWADDLATKLRPVQSLEG